MKTVHPAVKVCVSEKSQHWPQILAVITAGFLALGAGLHFGWPSPSIPKLLENNLQFKVTSDEISYITMLTPFGYFIGCPVSALLLDVLGRKKSLLLLAVPQILAWLLIATSNCIAMIYAARLVAGIAEGSLFTVLPVYLCEVSEPNVRGVLGTTHTVGMILGILVINCYGSYLDIRTTAYISLVVPLVFVGSFMWMPESPYYFLMKENTEDAKKSLRTLRRMHDVEEELAKLTSDVKRQISEPSSLKDLFFIRSNLKALFILVALRTLQQLSGISAFSVYTQVIFQQAGGGISPAESSIIYATTQATISSCGSVLMDRFGRKPMVIASSAGTAVFLFCESAYFYLQSSGYDTSSFKWVPIAGMMMYTVVNSVGLGVAPNLMSGELFPANIKAKALGVLNIYFAVCLSGSFKLFQCLDDSYGMHVPFFLFGVSCVVGIVFSCFCIPETKGKSLEEIQQILKGNSNFDNNKQLDKKEEVFTITKF